MTVYTGNINSNLFLQTGDDASEVTSVSGSLFIQAENAYLPALTNVGSWFYVHADKNATKAENV